MRTGFTTKWLASLTTAALLTAAALASAQDASQAVVQDEAAASEADRQIRFRYEDEWEKATAAGDYDKAVEIATTWVTDATVQFGDGATQVFEPLMRQAVSYEAANKPQLAAKSYGDAIKLAERRMGPFARELIAPLVGLGGVLAAAGEHEPAISNFMRAKSITHRTEGIFNPDQAPIVEQMTDSYVSMGEVRQATREQRFLFGTQEKLVGRNSVDFVPALQKWARWNARLQRFPDARRYFNEAIEILEENYGPNDLRLVDTLNMIAKAYYDNPRTTQNEGAPVVSREGGKALRRALEIYKAQEYVDQADVMIAQSRLGDWNMIAGRRTRAIENYEEAIAEALAAGVQGEVIDRVFGAPRILTHSSMPFGIWPRLQTRFADGTKSIIIEFDIGPRGRPRNIRIALDELKLGEVLKTIRSRVASTAYQPRFVDGIAVATYGVRQRYDFSPNNGRAVISMPVMPENDDAPADAPSDAPTT